MKYTIPRSNDIQDVKILVIKIGNDEYRLSESIDGRLVVNKTNFGEGANDTDYMRIHPRTGNEIEIS
jgi:hypothetical protein